MDTEIIERLRPWAAPAMWAAAALVAVLVAARIGHFIALRAARGRPVATALLQAAHRPAQLALALLALEFVRDAAPPALWGMAGLRHFLIIALIGALTWLAVKLINACEHAVALLYPSDQLTDVQKNLHARRVQTKAHVLLRTASGFVIVLGIACVLITFPGVRQFGAGLLASAGVIGIVAGLAAKPVFGNLLAGLQIAMTQPIRLDDIVIVKDQFAHVEEIGGTYVVLRIWDDRRMVVPLQWFIENPFENWTLTGSKLLGAVDLWVDFRMPMEPLRAELKRLVEAAPEWDRRTQLLVVNDSDRFALQVRALVSAANAGALTDLRNRVREGLVAFIGRHYREYLPAGARNPADQLAAEKLAEERAHAPSSPPRASAH
jgi:small-conductance mechanosensitive channel